MEFGALLLELTRWFRGPLVPTGTRFAAPIDACDWVRLCVGGVGTFGRRAEGEENIADFGRPRPLEAGEGEREFFLAKGLLRCDMLTAINV